MRPTRVGTWRAGSPPHIRCPLGETIVYFSSTLTRRFRLTPEEERILTEQVQALDRRPRRLYHERVEPRLAAFAAYLRAELRVRAKSDLASRWATQIGVSVAARGYASIAEQVAMEVVGRARVADVIRMLKAGGATPPARSGARGGPPHN